MNSWRSLLLAVVGILAYDGVSADSAASGCQTALGNAAEVLKAWRPKERWRGFNLLGMFRKDPVDWRSPGRFDEREFRWLHDWGFNFARLPLDYHYWIKNGDWNEIDEAAVRRIDEAIGYARKWGVHVQLCFHRAPGFCVNPPKEPVDLFEDAGAQRAFAKHWRFFARRYRGIPNDALSFNLFNEPDMVAAEKVERIMAMLTRMIREEDPERFIVADGRRWGREPLKAPEGPALFGQAVHCYDPFDITHYRMANHPGSKSLPDWPMDGLTGEEWLRKNLFAPWDELSRKGTFVMAGEFACGNRTPHEQTLRILEDYLKYFKAKGYGWALWNLRGFMGILDSDRKDVDYEDFHGYKLDRKLLELLQRY